MIQRNEFCWCGSGKKWKNCHYPEEGPIPASPIAKKYWEDYQILIKTPEQIKGIRKANHLAAELLDRVCEKTVAGISTLQLDELARTWCLESGATPASLGYSSPPYPNSLCTSLNEVICHGIPNNIPLKEGDIVNVDFACILNGYFGDCSKMVCIGKVDEEKQRVVDVSYECLMRSIEGLKPGVMLSHVGAVIEEYATAHHCSVVDQFVGHGVGIAYHENPQVPHFRNKLHIPLVAGMIFTIEPMINAGTKKGVLDSVDNWTVRTADGKPSAQWEHSLLITDDGVEILTPWKPYRQ